VSKVNEKAIDAHIGSRLRLRRLMLSMSQEALGESLSVTFQQIQKYEKGTNRISASRLFYIASILDVPMSYFFSGLVDSDDDNNEPMGLSEGGASGSGAEPLPYVSPYLAFVSSAEGIQLNQAFIGIGSANVRRDIVTLVSDLAQAMPMRRR
jgi:transcriptional regulator with XRE-family HTH domain